MAHQRLTFLIDLLRQCSYVVIITVICRHIFISADASLVRAADECCSIANGIAIKLLIRLAILRPQFHVVRNSSPPALTSLQAVLQAAA